ncbi:MAG: deoxynucleoside kinase [Chloroflexi bacterium]|nr:deoxynucleoside kinase [Chloroflexota bacterium]
MTKYFVAIAGNIGVGKSTFAELAARRLGWDPFFEAFEENPYLADFYHDMPRWSFHSQAFFLSRRLRQHHAMLEHEKSVIQDRSVYEDAEIFACNLFNQGHMTDRDWQTYCDLYRTLRMLLTPPNLVVYLRASVPTLLRRIAQRGRDYERSITAEYLDRLNALYDRWAGNFTLCPVLTVETDSIDYVLYDEHLDQIVRRIEDRLYGKETIALKTPNHKLQTPNL